MIDWGITRKISLFWPIISNIKKVSDMKKSLLSILAILLTASVAMGQACEPDPQFTDPGLFPLPESEGGEGLPVGCEDDPYEVVMTVVVPDSANVGGFSVPIDRIELVSIDAVSYTHLTLPTNRCG